MRVLSAIQPSFFPWRGYIDMVRKSDVFIFYDHVQYDKNGWRNRNKIIINKKPKWITVPIKKEKLSKKIKDVKLIESEKYLKKIYDTFYFNYKNHPNFKEIIKIIEDIFFSQKWNFLSDLNIKITKEICKYFKINTEFKISSELDIVDDKNLNLINLCKKFNCEGYLSGITAKNYVDTKLFKEHNIKVIWNDFKDFPYVQYKIENIFYEKLSMIDYMFNVKDKNYD